MEVQADGTIEKMTAERFSWSRLSTTFRLGDRFLRDGLAFDASSKTIIALPASPKNAGTPLSWGPQYYVDPNQELAYFATETSVWQTDGTKDGTRELTSIQGEEWDLRVHGALNNFVVFSNRLNTNTQLRALQLSTGEVTLIDEVIASKVWSVGRIGERIAIQVEFTDSFVLFTDGKSVEGRDLGISTGQIVGDYLFYSSPGQNEQTQLHVTNGSIFASGPVGQLLGMPNTRSQLIKEVSDGFVCVVDDSLEFVSFTGEKRQLGSFDRSLASRGNSIRVHKFGDQVIAEQPGRVFVTDGTIAGTKLYDLRSLGMLSEPVGLVGDTLVARGATIEPNGLEPWITDGSPEGTRMLLDISPGNRPLAAELTEVVVVGDGVYFTTREAEFRASPLWFSRDGEVARPITELLPTMSENSRARSLQRWNKFLLFRIESLNPETGVVSSHDWYVTDGTHEGTRRLYSGVDSISIRAKIEDDWLLLRNNRELIRLNDSLNELEIVLDGRVVLWEVNGEIVLSQYLPSAPDGERGPWLYRYADGEVERLSESPLGNAVIVENRLFAFERNGQRELILWSSDGTREGTKSTDVKLPPPSSWPIERLGSTISLPMRDGILFLDLKTEVLTRVDYAEVPPLSRPAIVADSQRIVTAHCGLKSGSIEPETVVVEFDSTGKETLRASFDGCLEPQLAGSGILLGEHRGDSFFLTNSAERLPIFGRALQLDDGRSLIVDGTSVIVTDGTRSGTYPIGDFGISSRLLAGDTTVFYGSLSRAELIPSGDINGDGILDARDVDAIYANAEEGTDPQRDADDLLNNHLWTQRGDTNLDGSVDFADFLIVSANIGVMGGYADGDFDGDSVVGLEDFEILREAFATRFEEVVWVTAGVQTFAAIEVSNVAL